MKSTQLEKAWFKPNAALLYSMTPELTSDSQVLARTLVSNPNSPFGAILRVQLPTNSATAAAEFVVYFLPRDWGLGHFCYHQPETGTAIFRPFFPTVTGMPQRQCVWIPRPEN